KLIGYAPASRDTDSSPRPQRRSMSRRVASDRAWNSRSTASSVSAVPPCTTIWLHVTPGRSRPRGEAPATEIPRTGVLGAHDGQPAGQRLVLDPDRPGGPVPRTDR